MTTPQKDVVYIDVEDDITAIIGKLKSGSREIVALVPPKRIGVLQSAVNLRLLARAAKQSKKQLVIITGNSSLSSLAAAAQIPVAATLQSKPELAEIAALDIERASTGPNVIRHCAPRIPGPCSGASPRAGYSSSASSCERLAMSMT